jgi:uncharacterized OB-fold protein
MRDEKLEGEDDEDEFEFEKCGQCGSYYHFTMGFCYKCLDQEAKWRLGVL